MTQRLTKVLATLLLVLVCAAESHATIAFSNQGGHANANNNNPVSVTVNAGDCVVVMVAFSASGSVVNSVSDNGTGGSNTYAQQITGSNGAGLPDVEVWTSIAVHAATTVTPAFSGAVNNGTAVATYPGCTSIGSSFLNTGTGTTLDSGTQTVSSSADFLVTALVEGGASGLMTAMTGNLRGQQNVNASSGRIGICDNTGSTSLDCSATISVSQAWVALSVDLKASSAAPTMPAQVY